MKSGTHYLDKKYIQIIKYMTPYEIKIRKNWLITTILVTLIPFIFLTILYFWSVTWNILDKTEIYTSMLVTLLYAIPSYILIHCTYKKFGTAYLTFNLIFSPFHFLKATFSTCQEIKVLLSLNGAPSSLIIIVISTVIANISIYIFWYWISLRIRKVNKVIQRRQILSSSRYQNAVTTLHTAVDLDDLNHKFHRIISDVGPSEFVKAIREVYLKHKLTMEKNV